MSGCGFGELQSMSYLDQDMYIMLVVSNRKQTRENFIVLYVAMSSVYARENCILIGKIDKKITFTCELEGLHLNAINKNRLFRLCEQVVYQYIIRSLSSWD